MLVHILWCCKKLRLGECGGAFIVGSSLFGYDGARDVRDEEYPVERKKLRRKSKSGLKKESGRWRPTKRQVLWAISMVATLGTIALLVGQLYPGLWEDVSREPVALLKGRVATLIGIGVALMVLIVLLAMGSASLRWTGFRGKTVWDLLHLLIVPLALAVIGFVFSIQQANRQDSIEADRARHAQELEDQRALAEQEIQAKRTEQATLQAYLDQMGTLLLDRNLRRADENSDVRRLARGRTLVVFDALSAFRQVRALRFLYEADLIQATPDEQPVISLDNISLPDIELPGRAFLRGAHLQQANLSGANLDHADLSDAYLPRAELQNTDLESADLERANLEGAFLIGANLSEANLVDADLSRADKNQSKRGANLRNANLSGANLKGANLSSAYLSGANLEGANVTDEQLAECESLEGATLSDGTKHP